MHSPSKSDRSSVSMPHTPDPQSSACHDPEADNCQRRQCSWVVDYLTAFSACGAFLSKFSACSWLGWASMPPGWVVVNAPQAVAKSTALCSFSLSFLRASNPPAWGAVSVFSVKSDSFLLWMVAIQCLAMIHMDSPKMGSKQHLAGVRLQSFALSHSFFQIHNLCNALALQFQAW